MQIDINPNLLTNSNQILNKPQKITLQSASCALKLKTAIKNLDS